MTVDEKPLHGRRIVVTRAPEQSAELDARLETLGAQVLFLPLVEFAPPDNPAPLDRALAELNHFDWLLLTSRNAVRFLAARARALSLDLPAKLAAANERPRVATVGKATAAAAQEQGWRVDHISSGSGGVDLARELGPAIGGCRILLPRSNRAMPALAQALAEAGARPVEAVAYKTISATHVDSAILDRIARGEVDALTFASPSAFFALVENVGMENLKRMIDSLPIAVIGPTTANAIRERGFAVAIEAQVPSAEGLAAAIASYFAKNPAVSGGNS